MMLFSFHGHRNYQRARAKGQQRRSSGGSCVLSIANTVVQAHTRLSAAQGSEMFPAVVEPFLGLAFSIRLSAAGCMHISALEYASICQHPLSEEGEKGTWVQGQCMKSAP